MDQGDRARHGSWMDETLIGYARCSTDEQDLTAQRQALHALGVPPDRVYIDHGISSTKRERPGLDQALAAVRTGDTLVVPKLERLARSVFSCRYCQIEDILDKNPAHTMYVACGSRLRRGRLDAIGRSYPSVSASTKGGAPE